MHFNTGYFLNLLFNPPQAVLSGLLITVCAAAFAMLFGLLLGLVLALMGRSRSVILRGIVLCYITFFRGTPLLVQLMLIYFGLPYLLGGYDLFPPTISLHFFSVSGAIVAGIVAFSLHEAAYLSEVIRSGLDAIDKEQIEAARSLGLTPVQVMFRIVLPQAARLVVPPIGNAVNAMFKTTSLLAFIGIPELFQVANGIQAATYRTFEVYLAISVYYLALTGIWTVAQNLLERRLNARLIRRAVEDAVPAESAS